MTFGRWHRLQRINALRVRRRGVAARFPVSISDLYPDDSDKKEEEVMRDDEFHYGNSEVIKDSISRLGQYRNEVTSVLKLLDGLASQWGDEAVSQVISGLYCVPDEDGGTPFDIAKAADCIRKQAEIIKKCRDRLRELVK